MSRPKWMPTEKEFALKLASVLTLSELKKQVERFSGKRVYASSIHCHLCRKFMYIPHKYANKRCVDCPYVVILRKKHKRYLGVTCLFIMNTLTSRNALTKAGNYTLAARKILLRRYKLALKIMEARYAKNS